jgi:acyl carrier protein
VLAVAGAGGSGLEAVDLESLQALVEEQVQTVLGSAVGGDDPLMAAGLDSLGATELQQSLADTLGMELPATLVFDYPTVNAMAEFLTSKLSQHAVAPAISVSALAPSGAAYSAPSSQAVAIVGAARQQELLQRHRAGDASARVPYARWDADSAAITADGSLPAQVSMWQAGADGCCWVRDCLGWQPCIITLGA